MLTLWVFLTCFFHPVVINGELRIVPSTEFRLYDVMPIALSIEPAVQFQLAYPSTANQDLHDKLRCTTEPVQLALYLGATLSGTLDVG